jgi:hypothetical protein
MNKINADYFIPTGSGFIGVGTGGFIQQQRVGYSPQIFYTYQQAYDADGNAIQMPLLTATKAALLMTTTATFQEKNLSLTFTMVCI